MRRSQFDSGSQPVCNLVTNPAFETTGGTIAVRTNLATNPSFETASGTVNVRTNLATNPSFETASGTVNVRTNLATNPSFETANGTVNVRTNLALDPSATSTSSWSNIGSTTTTRSVDSTVFHEGSTSIKVVLAAAGQSGSKCLVSNPGFVTGDVIRWSVWVYPSVAMTIQPYWERTSPTYTGGSGGPAVSCPANTWTQLTGSLTFTAAQADATGAFGFGFYSTASYAINDVFYADEIVVERNASLGTFFNGASAASGDFTYAWSGVANASTSVQRGIAAAEVSSSTYQAVGIQSSVWSARPGTKSLRVIPAFSATQDSFIDYPGISGRLSVGKTYTVSATFYQETPQTGTLDTRARNIRLNDNGVNYIAQATNIAGAQRISVTFTVVTSIAFLRLYNGASVGNGDVWWDDILIEETSRLGAYFDGSTPAATDFTYAWSGAANSSTSHQQAPGVSTWAPVSSLVKAFRSVTTKSHGTASMGVIGVPEGNRTSQSTFTASAGKVYTMSADMRHDSLVNREVRLDYTFQDAAQVRLGSYTAGPTIMMAGGQWGRRATTTIAAPAGTATITVYAAFIGATSSEVFWVDAFLLEETSLAQPYFDGSTPAGADFTYAWGAGGANTSVSYKQAPGVAGTDYVSSLAVAYQSKTGFTGGSKSIRITPTHAGSGDSFAEIGNMFSGYTFKANTTYTIAADRTLTAPQTNIAGTLHFRINIGTELTPTIIVAPNNVAGTVRVVGQFTTGAGTSLGFIRLYNGSYIGGGDVWWDNLTLDEGITTGEYFDGATATAGDFSHAWKGTANASQSEKRATALTYSSNFLAVSSAEWSSSGTKSARLLTPTTTSSDSFLSVTASAPLQTGKTYTISATMRMTAPQTGTLNSRARSICVYHSGTSSISSVAPNVAGVVRLSVTFKVTDGSAYQSIRLYSGSSSGSGDVWWDDVMIVEGTYSGDYVDGSKPLSKWDGTANASTSTGYPPQFFDIAGKPSRQQIGVGTTVSTNPAPDMGARTMYLVYESFGYTAPYQSPGSYGSGTLGRISIQTQSGGQNAMGVRLDFPGGDSNRVLVMPGGRKPGVHVFATTVYDGLGTAYACVDGGPDTSASGILGGTGWGSDLISLGAAQSETAGMRAYVFNAQHTRETRLAVSRYLGNKYGANVA